MKNGTDKYGLGRKPLPKDERDYLVRNAPGWADRIAENGARSRRFWGMVRPDYRIDQGAEGTCVFHAGVNVLVDSPVEHPDFPAFVTPEQAHQYARAAYLEGTGDDSYQDGAYSRQMLDLFRSRGLFETYWRLTTVDQVIDHLLAIGPVYHASDWFYSMFRPMFEYGNAYLSLDEASGYAGGHAYALTGADIAPDQGPPYVRMENSWGPGWGQNGTIRIAIDDLHVLFVGDAFATTEAAF